MKLSLLMQWNLDLATPTTRANTTKHMRNEYC
jgi:hypothetical protein